MGAIEKVSSLFELSAVEAGVYRCGNCGAEVESGDGSCPECGGDPESVAEPVQYMYREMY